MIWLWIFVVVVAVIVVLSFSLVKIKFLFSSFSENNSLELEVKALFGLIQYRYKIPKIDYKGLQEGVMLKAKQSGKNVPGMNNKPDEEINKINKQRIIEIYDKFKLFLAEVFDYIDWFKDTLAHFCCTEFRWTSRVGAGDAPATAILTGIGWGLKSSLMGYAFQFIRLQTKPFVLVQPQYNQEVLATNLSCMLNIRMASVLVSGFWLGIRFWKEKRLASVMVSGFWLGIGFWKAKRKRKVLQTVKSS